MPYRARPLEEYWYSANRGYVSPCWQWLGAICGRGYGTIRRNGKTNLAHRFVYIELKGSIPEGMQLDHLCGFKDCVNPDHVKVATNRENTRRYYNERKHRNAKSSSY